MKVRIDTDLCQGHQLCAVFGPDVFGSDDEGFAVLLTADGPATEADIGDEFADQVDEASGSCPEQAIVVGES